MKRPVDETADILERAADLLQFGGWIQGALRLFREDGQIIGRCALGGITDAMTAEQQGDFLVGDDAVIALQNYLGYETDLISAWNDNSNQTAEHVIDTLRHCAKDLRK